MLRRRAVQQRGCLVSSFYCSGRTLFICCLFGFNSSKDMLLYLFLFFSHFIGLIAGDTISPVRDEVSGREGESVILSCQYQTTETDVYLHWYRHDSDLQAPQFILYKGAKDNTDEYNPTPSRYQSQTTGTSTELTISRLTLNDTALYYCALARSGYWGAYGLLFGKAIRLTITANDISPVEPNMFVLSPLPQDGTPGPDVCLATGFRPRVGVMDLKVQNQNDSVTLRTTSAVLSRGQKTFFFAGFHSQTIDSCMLHNIKAQRKEPEVSCDKTEPEDPIPPPVEPVKQCVDLHPEKAKLNFYLLQMNSVRVVFTKALAFNTILTIRAVLF